MAKVPAYIELDPIREDDITKNIIATDGKHSIPFRDWREKGKQSDVFEIDLDYVRYRPENGRLKTEVLTYETNNRKLDPVSDETQDIIRGFIENLDKKKNEELKKALFKDGQTEPATITSDGYLINGNRRKWALSSLKKENPGVEKFKRIKVVILPNSKQPDRPNRIDIALLENRYQVHSDGKSEYSVMNKALTYRDNITGGISLEEMLADDSDFSGLKKDDKKFKQKKTMFEEKHLKPLEIIDEFLEWKKVKGDYESVSDRWQSFQESYIKIFKKIETDKGLIEFNIKEDEKGKVKLAVFEIIDTKDTSDLVHQNRDLVRSVKDFLKTDKKLFLDIPKKNDKENTDPSDDVDDEDFVRSKKDKLKRLINITKRNKDRADPINRLEEALQKLEHDDLAINEKTFPDEHVKQAFELTKEIENRNNELKSFFYNLQKANKDKVKDLADKFGKNKK